MEYLDIIEENFTRSDYVAYLRGSILRFLLKDEPLDIAEFKLYANKLAEIMDEPQVENKPLVKSAAEEPQKESTVDPDEPRLFKTHEFKLGDRVVIDKDTVDERTGTIVRLPRGGFTIGSNNYLVELDDKDLGWEATIAKEGVSCKNAWYACKETMTLLKSSINGSLEAGKWYHTKDFTVEQLQELLPKGTTIEAEKEVLYAGIENTPPEDTTTKIVERITTSVFGDMPLIEVTTGNFLKEWFKITEDL